jgi:hypothetical protein
MLDTTPVTTAITRLISSGITEQAVLAEVSRRFPWLTWRELSSALQVAQAAAERQASRRH